MRMHTERTGVVTKKFPNGELRLRPARSSLDIIDDEKANAYVIERVLTRIAQANQDGLESQGSAAIYALVMHAVRDEPFLRIKLELAKDQIKRAAEEGPITSEHDEVEMRAAVIEGEAVPGLLFEKSRRKSFGMTLATADGPDVEEVDTIEEVDRG